MTPPTVFISYGHADASLVDWVARLRAFLGMFERQQRLAVFDDRGIQPGAPWQAAIDQALQGADAAILLIGNAFLNSSFINDNELPPLLAAARTRGVRIYPVIIGFCPYKESPLGRFQSWNNPEDPLENQSVPNQNRCLNDLALQLMQDLSSRGADVSKDHDTARRRALVVGQRLVDVSGFKGRRDKQAEVWRLLASPATRLVTIVGRPGIGKTALASKVLTDLERRAGTDATAPFDVDGIAYLSARTSGISLSELLVQCGLMVGGDLQAQLDKVRTSDHIPITEKIQRLIETLSQGAHVILLDRIDDLLDESGRLIDPQLKALLDAFFATPNSARLLVTSCIPLGLEGAARRFNLQVKLEDGLEREDAIALLRELDPNNASGLRDAPSAVLAPAVERLHGVPRALEILAGILEDESPLASLEATLDRFYTLKDTADLFRESYTRLDDAARLAVRALAVFRRPMPVAAIAFLLAPFAPGLALQEVVQRLVRGRMMRTIRDESAPGAEARLALHALDEDYAYAQIPENGPGGRADLERRAAEDYRALRPEPERWRVPAGVEPMILEFQHIVRAGDFDDAARLLSEFEPEQMLIGSLRSLEMHEALDGRLTDPGLQMGHLWGKAVAQVRLGSIAEGIAGFERALVIARAQGADRSVAEFVGSLGEAARRLGRLDDALTWTSEAVEVSRRLQDPILTARWLNELSLLSTYRGDLPAAIAQADEALALATSDEAQRALALDALSLAWLRHGEPARALDFARQSITLYENTAWLHTTNYVLNLVGLAHLALGQVDDAIARLSDGLRQSTEDSDSRPQALAHFNLARAFRIKGDEAEALTHADAARRIFAGMKAGEHASARQLVEAIQAQRAGQRAAQAGALVECARASKNAPDLFDPRDLIVEAQRLAEAEHLPDLAAAAAALLV